jgi:hypothetical protein
MFILFLFKTRKFIAFQFSIPSSFLPVFAKEKISSIFQKKASSRLFAKGGVSLCLPSAGRPLRLG